MNHYRPITKMPPRAQTTNFQLLKQFSEDLATRFTSLQRSKPWGIYFPPGGGDDGGAVV